MLFVISGFLRHIDHAIANDQTFGSVRLLAYVQSILVNLMSNFCKSSLCCLWRPARRIAGGHIAALQTVLECQLPLLGRSMSPRLG